MRPADYCAGNIFFSKTGTRFSKHPYSIYKKRTPPRRCPVQSIAFSAGKIHAGNQFSADGIVLATPTPVVIRRMPGSRRSSSGASPAGTTSDASTESNSGTSSRSPTQSGHDIRDAGGLRGFNAGLTSAEAKKVAGSSAPALNSLARATPR